MRLTTANATGLTAMAVTPAILAYAVPYGFLALLPIAARSTHPSWVLGVPALLLFVGSTLPCAVIKQVLTQMTPKHANIVGFFTMFAAVVTIAVAAGSREIAAGIKTAHASKQIETAITVAFAFTR